MADADVTEAEWEAWCGERRAQVVDYLRLQGLEHGGVGDWPAWDVPPVVSVWALQSLKAPGWVGWWVICGDLPTDYCSADNCRHPRLAVRRIAQTWKEALASAKPGDQTIGDTGLPAHLAELLQARAETLLAWADDPETWAYLDKN